MPGRHEGLHRATRFEVRVDLNEWLGPELLGVLFRINEGADVVRLDAGKAARKVRILVDQMCAKFKNVQFASTWYLSLSMPA